MLLKFPDFAVAHQDLLPPAFHWEASFDTTNAPHLITLLRRIGLGFMPQPHNKLKKEDEDEGIDDDLDVGPVGVLLMDLDIYSRSPRNRNTARACPSPPFPLHRPTTHLMPRL